MLSIALAVVARLCARYAHHPCRSARQSLLVSYLRTRHLPGTCFHLWISVRSERLPFSSKRNFDFYSKAFQPRGSQTWVSPETHISPFPALCAEVTHSPAHLAEQSLLTAYLPASGISTIPVSSGAASGPGSTRSLDQPYRLHECLRLD